MGELEKEGERENAIKIKAASIFAYFHEAKRCGIDLHTASE